MAAQPLIRVPDAVGKYRAADGSFEIDVATVRDDHVYDSVGLGAQTIAANTTRQFFQGMTGTLGRQHFFNFAGRNQLPPKTALLAMMRIGLYAQQSIGSGLITTDDACSVYCNAALYARLDSTDVFYDGPVIGLPSGLGIWGATGDTSSPIATNGTPAMQSAPEVNPLSQWAIQAFNVLTAYVAWPANTWFADSNQGNVSAGSPVINNNVALTFLIRGPLATA